MQMQKTGIMLPGVEMQVLGRTYKLVGGGGEGGLLSRGPRAIRRAEPYTYAIGYCTLTLDKTPAARDSARLGRLGLRK
jgi:hypothetical protein